MSTPKPPIAIVSLEWDVVDLVESIGAHRILGFFDASPECATRDFRYLGTDDAWPGILAEVPDLKIALAIDHPDARQRLFDHYGRAALHNGAVSNRSSAGH